MKIAINVWLLRKKKLDGIGVVIKETASRLIEKHPEAEFLILCDKNFDENYFDFPNAKKYPIFPPFRHPLLYIFYLEIILPLFLRKHKPDIFLGLDGMGSLASNCKQLVCIHDLNFVHQPQHLDLKNRLYYRFFSKRHAKQADRLITVSNYTKHDIVESYAVSATKIDVMYLGVKALTAAIDPSDIKRKYTSGKDYFLFVGSLHPRKNIVRLIQAFDLFKKETGSDFALLLSGDFMWDNAEIKKAFEQAESHNDIVFSGRLDDSLLGSLYAASTCVTFVPTFEGFGLPIVEAFSMGTPVICSNVTSMPEVAGDAALLVDPYDVSDIKKAMVCIYRNEKNIKEALIEKGKSRCLLFSWDNAASLLSGSIQKALKSS